MPSYNEMAKAAILALKDRSGSSLAASPSVVTLDGLVLTGGRDGGQGAGMHLTGNSIVTATRCRIEGNGIWNQPSEVCAARCPRRLHAAVSRFVLRAHLSAIGLARREVASTGG